VAREPLNRADRVWFIRAEPPCRRSSFERLCVVRAPCMVSGSGQDSVQCGLLHRRESAEPSAQTRERTCVRERCAAVADSSSASNQRLILSGTTGICESAISDALPVPWAFRVPRANRRSAGLPETIGAHQINGSVERAVDVWRSPIVEMRWTRHCIIVTHRCINLVVRCRVSRCWKRHCRVAATVLAAQRGCGCFTKCFCSQIQ
jgi:hypothetical protein